MNGGPVAGIQAIWPEVVEAGRAESRFLAEALASCTIVGATPPNVVVRLAADQAHLLAPIEKGRRSVEAFLQVRLGVPVTLLNADDLAWGDLSRFGTIVAGIRAYEHRDDLIANNNRLLEYVRNGGTFIVQYNRDPFNAAQYGPYPAVVSSDRVTDENSPVRILVPNDPIFTSPNRIGGFTQREP